MYTGYTGYIQDNSGGLHHMIHMVKKQNVWLCSRSESVWLGKAEKVAQPDAEDRDGPKR